MTHATENTWDSFIDSLEDDVLPVTGTVERKQFPCQQCAGTGKWHRVNQHGNDNCIACQGRGFFYTSEADRRKAKAQRAQRKINKRTAGVAEFDRQYPGLYAALKSYDFSEFAQSLAGQIETRGNLSDKQLGSAQSMRAKMEARAEAKKAADAAPKMSLDLSPIIEMFERASANYKKPMYRAHGLRIKPGKEGALYVMDEERMEFGHFGEQPMYIGKIVDGEFRATRKAEEANRKSLTLIAVDPKRAAINYGRMTGRCSCCGRELTKHASIDAGIGPICAEKWGL